MLHIPAQKNSYRKLQKTVVSQAPSGDFCCTRCVGSLKAKVWEVVLKSLIQRWGEKPTEVIGERNVLIV